MFNSVEEMGEYDHGTDPYDSDMDNDTISDGIEVLAINTDPLNPDTDNDSATDG